MKEANKRKWEEHVTLWKTSEYYQLEEIDKNPILTWLKKLPRSRVLDEGCGIGQYTISIAMLGFKITGLDFSPKLLKIAKKNVKKYRLSKRCKFIKGDIRKLPLKDKSFNIVVSAGIIEHVPETEYCLKEISRVLKSKGYLLLHVPQKISVFTINKLLQQLLGIWKVGYEKSFTKTHLIKLLDKYNFKVLDEITPEIEKKSFILKILRILDKPLRLLGFGGHHIHLLCQKN